MRTPAHSFISLFALAITSFACSSAPAPAAQSPAPAQPTAKSTHEADTEQTETAATETPADGPSADAEAADPRADGLRKPSRPPADLITGPNLVYVFNFKDSAVGESAKNECGEKFGDSKQELAACLEKARSKVPVESVRFVKETSGDLWFITYNRYKGNLLKWHKLQFQVGKETSDHVVLNLVGKDRGIAPLASVPRSVEVELPNDYTIVVHDRELGRMSYDAKIGMIDD
jgi:hypothetical protein